MAVKPDFDGFRARKGRWIMRSTSDTDILDPRRQIAQANGTPRAQQASELDHIAQLPDVSRPVIAA